MVKKDITTVATATRNASTLDLVVDENGLRKASPLHDTYKYSIPGSASGVNISLKNYPNGQSILIRISVVNFYIGADVKPTQILFQTRTQNSVHLMTSTLISGFTSLISAEYTASSEDKVLSVAIPAFSQCFIENLSYNLYPLIITDRS